MKRKRFDWSSPIEAAIVAAIILGANIPLFIYSQSSVDAKISAIHEEMKDFHDRLIRIEERRR